MTDETPHLRVVDIKPPDYKYPATMLRNIAEDIEKGIHGNITTIAVAIHTDDADDGHTSAIFSGGRDSSIFHVCTLFSIAHARLMRILIGKPDG